MTDLADAIKMSVAAYTIGFLRFKVQNDKADAVPAGSGTLIDIGGIKGILTAAHVLAELPDEGLVGLVRFRNKEDAVQKFTLDLSKARKICLGKPPFKDLVPDIAFLQLPFDTAGSLGATNSYVDFTRAREAVEPPSTPYFDAVVGEIGEWIEDLPPKAPDTRKRGVRSLFLPGNIVRKFALHGYDLIDLELVHETGFDLPESYGGVSGGGLWRCYLDDKAAPKELRGLRLHGVAFWENDPAEAVRFIRCHGPKSVFTMLYNEVARLIG